LDEAWLFLRKPFIDNRKNIFWLDRTGDSRRVARRLFSLLQRLDEGTWRVIHAELARDGALAEAINDRLRRAASRD
jgi:hypothetical protein